MRNIKEYKAPVAEITVFECADVITDSNTPTSLSKQLNESGTYVPAGSKKWSDIYSAQ